MRPCRQPSAVIVLVAAAVVSAAPALCAAAEELKLRPIGIDLAQAYAAQAARQETLVSPAEDASDASLPAEDGAEPRIPFGFAGSQWISIGGGAAYDFDEEYDYNIFIAYNRFIADELEFAVELGGWYFDQQGENTGGVNPNMVFRWHFLHDEDFTWSIYGDAGIGVLFSPDEVPSGGTAFNFTPRFGVGYTRQLGEGDTRLVIGARYHHISNGRIEGDGNNPSRDSLMLYAAIMFPF